MVTRRKPEFRNLICGQRGLLGLAPDDCLVIEDSPAGIRAGKAAGCTVLGYTGSSIRQDVSAADFALSDFHLYRQIPLRESFSVLIL